MKSLLLHLRDHAHQRERDECVRLISSRKRQGSRTFADVFEGASRAASFYASRGISCGDIVVLIGTHHLDFYSVWLGAVWVGAIPTVLAEPSVRIDRGIYAERLARLLERIEAKAIALEPSIDLSPPAGTPVFRYDEISAGDGDVPTMCKSSPEDLLLLQHSSGTTGLQKGVMLSHGAVTRHARAYGTAIEASKRDVVATWLPLYHDMGLIACFLLPLFIGMKVVWLSPFEWVSNPGMLLDAVTEHRATLTWLPNFAYKFLAQRSRGKYDLSSLRAVINCSEPVSEPAMLSFAERFAGDGLGEAALHTCYALAENVFAVTTSTSDQPRRRLHIDRTTWLNDHRAIDGDKDTIMLVSNGRCIEGCDVRIADQCNVELPPRETGRILIRSGFLFDGYFRRDDLNQGLFDQSGFFDTGDLGFIDEEGHLYVTGRKKDLIIVGGRNVYPQDIEEVANETKGVYPGRVVCFGVTVERLGTEALVVLAESELEENAWSDIARRIRKRTAALLDLDLLDARIVPRKALRKSTSGKLARAGNREWYLEGRFGRLPSQLSDQRS